jgi:hypothetical protein
MSDMLYWLMELSLSWDVANCAATHEFPSILRNQKVPNRVHKSLSLVPILSKILGRLSIEFVQVRGFLWSFEKSLYFYGDDLLAPRSTSKLEDPHSSAISDCFFNTFAAEFNFWRPSPPITTWGHATPWWQGTHLTCDMLSYLQNQTKNQTIKYEPLSVKGKVVPVLN